MRLRLWSLALLWLVGCSGEEERHAVPADRIYVGRVLTMDDRLPRADAVAVRQGRILAVGSQEQVLAHRDERTVVTYLSSGCVVPGFVEAHGHVAQAAMRVGSVPLDPPPLGGVASIDDLVATLQGRQSQGELAPGEWLVGWGYDDAALAERRHPTRHDLDRVAQDRPVLVVHRSGHVVALNTAGLARAGVTARTRNPPGGRIERDPVGGPTGVLEGAAIARVQPLRERRADPARFEAALREALALYAAHGVTTCQEAYATSGVVEALRAAGARAPLPVDVVAFVTSRGSAAERLLGRAGAPWPTYDGGVRLGGMSLLLDGSLLGRTAWLSAPYAALPANPLELAACDDPFASEAPLPPTRVGALYAGYPALRADEVERQLRRALGNGWDVMAHCQGDAAADQLLEALERVRRDLADAPAGRVTLVHGLALRDDQLDRMKAAGVVPSFLVGSVHAAGDRLRDLLLGPARASRLAPTGAALARGLPFALHEDAPRTPSDPLRSVASAVTRRTASGTVLGPEQRVTVEAALKAVTLHPARLLGEDPVKGSIEVGKLADLVILSGDPTRCDEPTLRRIEVLQTIKAGQTVYRRGEGP